MLLVLVLGVTWLGMSNAVREIAREMPIFRRERAAGLSIVAYVGLQGERARSDDAASRSWC